MEKIIIDNGRKFDFGKTSEEYAKYRDIYPQEVFDKLYELGVGRAGTNWLDLGTGTGVIPRGLAKYGANIVGIDIAENQIKQAEKLSKEYNNIQYKVCSAEDIDYADGTFDVITACQCFWYFDPNIIVPKIKSLLKTEGRFLKLYMTYAKGDEIASSSWAMAKEINTNWSGGSAVKDLTTHYFNEPQMDSILVDIPFTRESWHGRMMASRGVMASMDKNMVERFHEKHFAYMESLPEQFIVKHKAFFTWYYPNK